MRAFFVIMLFLIAFLTFIGGTLQGVNLTSNTPGSASSAQAAAPASTPVATEQPQVITIQESSTATNQSGSVPVTGGCSNPYTVQPGDTLLAIANACNTTLAAIRQANPQITDANVIFPGQQLDIPNASAAQSTLVIPATGKEAEPAATPFVPLPLPTEAAPAQGSPTAVVPLTGAYPLIPAGAGLQVKAIGYPANTPVNIAIGPQNQGYTPVANGVTDANGDLTTNITVPEAQNSQTPYVVVVATTGSQPIQAMSLPFFIGPAQSSNP